MAEFTPASRGVANAGLTTGIIGTALGVLNGGLPNILGNMTGNCGCNRMMTGCSEDHLVDRYTLAQEARIAELETEVKLRDANTFTMGEMNKMRNYVDDRLTAINNVLGAQAVHNQRTEDSFVLARQDIAAVRSELMGAIEREAERRCCGDNSIVTYANATFYPKLAADISVATTTTAQTLYNPIPKCGCCCNGG